MGAALFYHLTRSAPETLLPVLIGKSLDAGWRVELRGRSAGTLAALDQRLWQGEGFLPHGLAGGPHDARQPVLLTLPDQPATNLPACLIAIEGSRSPRRIARRWNGSASFSTGTTMPRWTSRASNGAT